MNFKDLMPRMPTPSGNLPKLPSLPTYPSIEEVLELARADQPIVVAGSIHEEVLKKNPTYLMMDLMDNPSKYDEDDRDLIERMYEGRKKIEKELSGVSQQQFKELVEKYWEHEPSKPPARPKHVTHEHRRREPCPQHSDGRCRLRRAP